MFSSDAVNLLGFLAAGLVLAVVTAFVFAKASGGSFGVRAAVGPAATSSPAMEQAVTATPSAAPEKISPVMPETPGTTSPTPPAISSASMAAPPPLPAGRPATKAAVSQPPTAPAPGTAEQPPPAPRGGCSASMSVNQWPGGFVATLRVFAGSSPVNGWAVVMTLPRGAGITNAWNAGRSGNTGTVRFTNVSYNGSIAPGQSIEFGYQATGTGTEKTPACSGG
ncbi:MAG TPA: cellulose binding domain-containing protein [Amycolatopsis sp.]|nr:cellulose binding domain-containing protein [Amycolatopsis sp.]